MKKLSFIMSKKYVMYLDEHHENYKNKKRLKITVITQEI